MGNDEAVFWFLLIVVGLPLYFAPSILAFVRHKRNRVPILLLNTVFGWTVAGWVCCLLWAAYLGEVDDIKQKILHAKEYTIL